METKTGSIDDAELQVLAGDGGIISAHAIAQEDGWCVMVRDKLSVRALCVLAGAATNRFPSLDALADHLRALGVGAFDVSLADPLLPASDADPDYDEWLRAEVQEAMDDPRPGIPHEEAIRMLRALSKS